MKNVPAFLVIGAAKSGTTAVFNFLRQHPQIFMAEVKETNFFTYEGVENLDYRYWGSKPWYLDESIRSVNAYCSFFEKAPVDAVCGEASVSYLYHPQVASKIKTYSPQARLIAILRNPVERAHSHYQHIKRDGHEPLTFLEALHQEPERIRERWVWDYHYASMSLYHQQLQAYWKVFPTQQLRIFLYDDFKSEPARIMREIFEFIGVDPAIPINVNLRFNVSGKPRSSFFHRLVYENNLPKRVLKTFLPFQWGIYLRGKIERTTVSQPEPIPEAARRVLRAFLQDDIWQLQAAIGRDLSHWLA